MCLYVERLTLAGLFFAAIVGVGCGGQAEGPLTDQAEPLVPDENPPQVLQRDIDGDGRPDVLSVFSENGLPVRAEADTNGDATVDLWAKYAAPDQIGEIAYDRDFDGQPDEWEQYDGSRVMERARDTTRDGSADLWHVINAEGQLIGSRQDTNRDGEPDVWSTLGPGGELVRAAYDTNQSGQPDRWVNYGDGGEILSVETDTDGDGIPDETIVRRKQRDGIEP